MNPYESPQADCVPERANAEPSAFNYFLVEPVLVFLVAPVTMSIFIYGEWRYGLDRLLDKVGFTVACLTILLIWAGGAVSIGLLLFALASVALHNSGLPWP